MRFADEEAPAGSQQRSDDVRPSADVSEPAQGADAREDQIKRRRRQEAQSIVDRALNERKLFTACSVLSKLLRFGEGSGREIQSHHAGGAAAGEREGIRADVALEVHDVEAGDGW